MSHKEKKTNKKICSSIQNINPEMVSIGTFAL